MGTLLMATYSVLDRRFKVILSVGAGIESHLTLCPSAVKMTMLGDRVLPPLMHCHINNILFCSFTQCFFVGFVVRNYYLYRSMRGKANLYRALLALGPRTWSQYCRLHQVIFKYTPSRQSYRISDISKASSAAPYFRYDKRWVVEAVYFAAFHHHISLSSSLPLHHCIVYSLGTLPSQG